MKSRALRVTVALAAIAAVGAAGYLAWRTERRELQRRTAFGAYRDALAVAQRAAGELRPAQQAYVAAGQSETFWIDKAASLAESLRAAIGTLDSASPSPAARDATARATTALAAFEAADRRARMYAATGQKLLASDIIFGEGLPAASALAQAFEEAQVHSAIADDTARRAARREQLVFVASGTGALLLAVLLLTPGGAPPPMEAIVPATASPAAAPTLDFRLRDDPQPRRPPAAATAKPAAAPAPQPPAPPPAPQPPMEIQTLAAVCTDLAALDDTDRLPGILERTAQAIDASGLVLWVADVAGSELVPVATHGYPASVLARLGTIERDAANVTAAAFRTGLVQTVAASGTTSGAIAAPLVTPSGCRGVLSAEVRGGAEMQPARLAAAAIVAAQLSALVGPPPATASPEREAAL